MDKTDYNDKMDTYTRPNTRTATLTEQQTAYTEQSRQDRLSTLQQTEV